MNARPLRRRTRPDGPRALRSSPLAAVLPRRVARRRLSQSRTGVARSAPNSGLTDVDGHQGRPLHADRAADRLHGRPRRRRGRRRRRVAARRRARHARNRPARSAQHGRPGQRDRARRAAAPTASTPRRASSAISKSGRSAGTSAPRGVVPIVPARDPVRPRVRRRPEDPARRPTAATGRRTAAVDGAGRRRQRRRRRRRDGRQDRRAATRAMKGGIGSAAIALPNGLVVGAHRRRQRRRRRHRSRRPAQVVAGVRTADGKSLADARKLLRVGRARRAARPRAGENTTIAVVATNARLTKAEVNRVALMADDGAGARDQPVAHASATATPCSRSRPAGGPAQATSAIIGALAAEALAEAIVRAATAGDRAPAACRPRAISAPCRRDGSSNAREPRILALRSSSTRLRIVGARPLDGAAASAAAATSSSPAAASARASSSRRCSPPTSAPAPRSAPPGSPTATG